MPYIDNLAHLLQEAVTWESVEMSLGDKKWRKMEKMELNLDCVPADHRVIGIEISPQCLKESLVPPAVTKMWFGSAQRC